MANYQLLKADIDKKVYQNAEQKITGENLNSVLNEMVTTLGAEYQFAGVATKDTNPEISDAKVFYIANGKGTYTNFGGLEVTEDDVVVLYYDTAWHKAATGIASQAKLSELESEVIYDVTANNDGAKFPSLSALLSSENLSTLIPTSVRHGGMSIRFVQSSDNKYVQYRLMAAIWSINTDDWAIAEEGIYVNNPEFVYVKTDAEDKILWAIKTNGDIYFGAGVPQQVIDYVVGSDTTLKALIDSKLDAEGLDTDALETIQVAGNPKYIKVTIDSEGRILEGITAEGVKQINIPIDTPSATFEHVENSEWSNVTIDSEGRILRGRKTDGTLVENAGIDVKDINVEEGVNFSNDAMSKFQQDLINAGFNPGSGDISYIEEEVNNLASSVDSNLNSIKSLQDDVSQLAAREASGFNFGTSQFLSDKYGANIFFKDGKVAMDNNGTFEYIDVTGYSATYFVNIERVVYIEYQNLHIKDTSNGIYPIFLYKSDYTPLAVAEVVPDSQDASCGTLDLTQYPLAKYAIFNNNGDNNTPLIKMYTSKEVDKLARNDIKIGCYYFAGFFETTFPNIHNTEALLTTYNGRKPFIGHIGNGCFKGSGLAITPNIQLSSGISTVALTHSCLFYTENQCAVLVRDISNMQWVDVTPVLPQKTKTTMSQTSIDISSFAGKTIQIGFRLTNHASEESAIWTINGISVTSNGSVVYSKDYTDHSNFDLTVDDSDVWKPAVKTLGYEGLNGYVGSTYDFYNSAKIDKEITLAKACGIDYFMLEWYYHDGGSAINVNAIENEENHIGIHNMMRSCAKLGFHFALMIANHSPFIINGIDNWKDTFRYLNEKYYKDPSYMFIDGKPVVCIYDINSDFNQYFQTLNEFFITEFGYNGMFLLRTGYNTAPNTGEVVEKDISILYNAVKNANISMYSSPTVREGNFVPYITCGWDSRPWAVRPSGYSRPSDWFVPDTNKWKELFSWAFDFTKVSTNIRFKSMLICAWNEYGEGSYLAPTKDDMRGDMLMVVKETKNNKIV